MSTNDAQRRRKSQSPAMKLRGEERIEYSSSGGFVHAAPGIAHLERNAGSGSDMDVLRTDMTNRGRYRDRALIIFADSLHGVVDESRNHQPNLVRIRIDGRQVRGDLKLNADALRERRSNRPGGFPD